MSKELENEAKTYIKKKRNVKTIKPLTARRYLAGQALAGLLPTSKGLTQMSDLQRVA